MSKLTLPGAFPQLVGNGPTGQSIEGKRRSSTAFPAVGWKNSHRRTRSWLEESTRSWLEIITISDPYSMVCCNTGAIRFQPTAAALRVSIHVPLERRGRIAAGSRKARSLGMPETEGAARSRMNRLQDER